tara:strand:+ start:596 stop:1063 length:468 start_codon:yes stop_codon:yes gene_type:complete
MTVKLPVNKCVNKNCNNTINTIGYTRSKYPKGTTPARTSYATSLCQTCRRQNTPIIISCTICGTSIHVKHLNGGVRMTCSEICRKKRHAILCKEKYRKKHPLKINICLTCGKLNIDYKYCSKLCYPNTRVKGSIWNKITKFKKLKKELENIGYKL